jgi:membrane-bound ClpP family serine protease
MVQGELWKAETTGEPLAVGEHVRVVAVQGLRLTVQRVE